MTKTLAEIQKYVDQLVKMGEDPEEFSFWLAVYETLPDDIKVELGSNMESEVKELEQTFQPKPTVATAT